MDDVYAIIMAGGSGTRFWPLSRESMPKQLLKMDGGETLIRQTIFRIGPLIPLERIFMCYNKYPFQRNKRSDTKYSLSYKGLATVNLKELFWHRLPAQWPEACTTSTCHNYCINIIHYNNILYPFAKNSLTFSMT